MLKSYYVIFDQLFIIFFNRFTPFFTQNGTSNWVRGAYQLTLHAALWCLSNRRHRGRSERSFSRSNSRNRSTSRAPPCHRTTPSDQWGGSSGHQPMNVALLNGQRPTQTKAKAKGGHAGQTSSTNQNQRSSRGGKQVRAKGWGHCVHCQPRESR